MMNQPCPRCGNQNPADIHTCTPLALKLADALDKSVLQVSADSADELRRLYSENENYRKRYVTVTSRDLLKEAIKEDEALLRQALEALEAVSDYQADMGHHKDAITALRERLGEKT